jgi:hypothetical protein
LVFPAWRLINGKVWRWLNRRKPKLIIRMSRSQWPSGLMRVSMADRLLGLRVRIPPGAWMVVRCEYCACCQLEVAVTGWSLFQRSPTDCGASLCVISEPQQWGGSNS